MPGTSETFEIKNFDGVSNKLVDAIRLLINHYSMQYLSGFLAEGIPAEIKQQFPTIKDEEWEFIALNVLFSKVTSLELNAYYSAEQLNYLIELLSFCYNRKKNTRLLPEDLPNDYLIARNWLKKAYSML